MDDGRYMTLALVFNPERTHILMCYHAKQGSYNFIGGKSAVAEEYEDTTYRELYEESGITRDDVDLEFLHHERVSCKVPGMPECWSLYLMTGVLKHDVKLKEESNKLEWIPVSWNSLFQYDTFGLGNCWFYLREAATKLNIDIICKERQ